MTDMTKQEYADMKGKQWKLDLDNPEDKEIYDTMASDKGRMVVTCSDNAAAIKLKKKINNEEVNCSHPSGPHLCAKIQNMDDRKVLICTHYDTPSKLQPGDCEKFDIMGEVHMLNLMLDKWTTWQVTAFQCSANPNETGDTDPKQCSNVRDAIMKKHANWFV
eukprot:TRINITY_DN97818_c0_g1_i1.p1 TRINITY_DN97818_c0_g1~~TRINITY_DN97818_c0_g1_i1.p1  ORF type:complete len:162 (+),score=19.24 TRINITY_DN97818_c0_g1_i1:90-575(+)